MGAGYNNHCFSTGVKESITTTGEMMLVGTVEVVTPNAATSDYVVDCQGVQTTVTVAQQQRPECQMASERDCVAGQCP